MYPGAPQGGNDINNSQPPRWGPEMEHRYTFKKYSRDALMWIMATNVPQERHCATLILSLSGAARDLAEELGPEFIANGGPIPKVDQNGNVVMTQVNAVTYLMHHLQLRFGPLDEETRMKAVHEWNNFKRRPGEGISALLNRFEQTQRRAEHDAGIVQPYETTAYKLLQVLGFTDLQMVECLKPYGYKTPNTREQYVQMCQDLRRHLRLLEHHPGNIGQYLNGPTFYVNQDNQYQQQDMQMQTYFAGDPAMQTTSYSSFYDSPPQYGNTAQAYTVQADESSMETSSCTSSDYGPEFDPIADEQGNVVTPTIEKAESNPAYGEQVFLQYTRFKKAWRRFAHKPTRRFRRFCKRKGKGRGKILRSFLSDSTNEDMDSFFQRNFNKRYHGKSSGKG